MSGSSDFSGTMFGPSDGALSGSWCVSMKTAATPIETAARAKTGTLSLVATLSGTTTTDDGVVLAYAFMVNGAPNGWAAKVWTDQAVGAITACGC